MRGRRVDVALAAESCSLIACLSLVPARWQMRAIATQCAPMVAAWKATGHTVIGEKLPLLAQEEL
jgi:hypothetical protein